MQLYGIDLMLDLVKIVHELEKDFKKETVDNWILFPTSRLTPSQFQNKTTKVLLKLLGTEC